MKAILKNLVLLAGVLVFCALALEGMTRLIVDDGMSYELEMWKYARLVKMRDPEIGHRHRRNSSAGLMGVPVRTNDFGLRGPAIADTPAPGVARIAFVGDSIAMGWGVAEQETFAHRVIADLVGQGRKVDGFNLGVGNYNTTQELALFQAVGARLKPDIIVLAYFINDAEPIPTYPRESWLDLHSAAWIVLKYRIDSLVRQSGSQPDWKQYYRGLYGSDAAGWTNTQRDIGRFAELARKLHVPLIVFNIPELRELRPYPFADVTAKVRAVAEAQKLPFVDLLPTVEALAPPSLWVTVPDPHPNGAANAAFAKGMTQELLPVLRELCSKQSKGC